MIVFVWSEVRFYVPKSSIQKPLKLYLVWLAKDFICKWQEIYFFKLILSFWFFLHHRDNGISIQISILQWGIEIVNQIVYVCFVLFLHGNSYFIDRLMGLYVISFTMIIQPAFYLNGDYKFRRNWDKKGPISAIKSAVWDCVWGVLWQKYRLIKHWNLNSREKLPTSFLIQSISMAIQ